jgi:hypothetical protein
MDSSASANLPSFRSGQRAIAPFVMKDLGRFKAQED